MHYLLFNIALSLDSISFLGSVVTFGVPVTAGVGGVCANAANGKSFVLTRDVMI